MDQDTATSLIARLKEIREISESYPSVKPMREITALVEQLISDTRDSVTCEP